MYVENGGLAQLNRCYFIYNGFNPVNNTHGTIYCESGANLEIGNTNIQRNYCAGGTAGIYCEGLINIKIKEGLTVKKNFIPTGVLQGNPATAEAAGIHINTDSGDNLYLYTSECQNYTQNNEAIKIPIIKNMELSNDLGLVDMNFFVDYFYTSHNFKIYKVMCLDSNLSQNFLIKNFTYNGKAVSTARIGWKGNNGKNYYYDLQKDAVINTEYVQGILIQ